jgi:hypothetical protein
MSITYTTNYRDTLAPETVQYIETELLPNNFDLGSILEFVDENGEDSFNECYPEYVELGEQYGFEAVDAWLTLADADEVEKFTDAYVGEFDSPEEMAQDYLDYESSQSDYRLCIDWTETAECLLAHEVDRAGNFYFRSSY